MKKISAKPISYSSVTRDRKTVLATVVHSTGNKGDTAENNGNYYKNGNERKAGAHFFIDQKGNVVKSINLNRTAWAVGGEKWSDCNVTGGGKYYGKYNNANTVSIELCDIVDKEPSDEMIAAVWRTIKYIRKYCPNATEIIRHFDVNGKHCPALMMNEGAWTKFCFRLLAEALR